MKTEINTVTSQASTNTALYVSHASDVRARSVLKVGKWKVLVHTESAEAFYVRNFADGSWNVTP